MNEASATIIDTFTARIGNADVAVLMPVHNEAGIIEEVVLEFYGTISREMPVEIVLSEDGSTDGTKEVITRLSKKTPLKAILSTKRKGYALGIKDGLRIVEAEYVLMADSDGQVVAEDFWKLWDLRGKYDVVSGWRAERADVFHRKVMSKFFQLLTRTALKLPRLQDVTCPYKLMKSELAKLVACEFKYMNESFWTEFTVRAIRKGCRIIEVPVRHRARLGGSTRVYKLSKIPKIALSQFKGLLKLRQELNAT